MSKQINKIRKQPNTPIGEVAVQLKIDNKIRRFDSSKDGVMALVLQDGNIFSSVHIDGEDLVECFIKLFEGDMEIGRMASLALQSIAEEFAKSQSQKPVLFAGNGRRIN